MPDDDKKSEDSTTKELLAEIKALRAQNEQLNAQFNESKEEATKAKQYLAALVQYQKEQAEALADGDDTDKDTRDPITRFKETFEKDPMKAIDEHVGQRLGPVFKDRFERDAQRERDAAKAKHPELFEKYGEEIDRFMEPMALETKASAGSWEQAAQFVRMSHFDDEVKERVDAQIAEVKKNYDTTGLIEAPSSTSTNGSSTPALGKMERDIAKEFGMSPEEWAKYGSTSFEPPAEQAGGEES